MSQSHQPEPDQVQFSDLSGFQRDILSSIARHGPSNGLDIQGHLRRLYSEDINPPRVYDNLEKLKDKGLIDKSKLDGRSNTYAVTDEGREIMRAYAKWVVQSLE
ncbi:PadR family transcriptional regulator [Halorhabdus tiamatea]|uniref:PadR family transcriptional regulator n=1 Tax=Halorhabdus tiamatea TaxID=430914 RepID=UPI000212276E